MEYLPFLRFTSNLDLGCPVVKRTFYPATALRLE